MAALKAETREVIKAQYQEKLKLIQQREEAKERLKGLKAGVLAKEHGVSVGTIYTIWEECRDEGQPVERQPLELIKL